MTSLFGGSSAKPTPTPADITARVEQFKDRVRNELALQNAQEIMNKVNEKCFAKCVPKPGSSLSSSEEKCLSQCMDRYLDAFDLVNRSYVARLRKERLDQQSSPDSL
ncbi:Tim10/DDP family zinc finger-domain-containing protein [Trametes maxima]|nr:Tim10/DDP family zinc finger-domain-containing protein [Trametes maxima]